MRAAVLDIGSNSVRLLVADVRGGELTPLFRGRSITRLIGGMKEGRIAEEAALRTASAVCQLAGQAQEQGAEHIFAFGTSALRDAKNQDDFIARVKRECGVAVEVLSGQEEARYGYLGAALPGPCGVIDIGGGSTEVLLGENGQIQLACSVDVGAVRLMEQMGPGQGWRDMLKRAAAPLRDKLLGLDALAQGRPWVGVGGTITTLMSLEMGIQAFDARRLHGNTLPLQRVRHWLLDLTQMSIEERGRLPGMSPGREDILPYGAAILCAFSELSGAPELKVSTQDNLEGYLKERMKSSS